MDNPSPLFTVVRGSLDDTEAAALHKVLHDKIAQAQAEVNARRDRWAAPETRFNYLPEPFNPTAHNTPLY